jgi:RNA polymerase sigma-70 factor, ECF subfamily
VKPTDFAEIFSKYGPAVYRRARYLLANHADAEEATQEVFVRALKSAEGFEHRAGVYTWLSRITTNYCLNLLRDRRRRGELWDQHMAPLPGCFPPSPRPEALIMMRRLLAEAEPECARAAVYVLVDGMSHEEAAQHLEVSRRTVGNLLDRFRNWARDCIEQDWKNQEDK